jgi:predicted nucleic acid-binding protein
VDASVWVSRFLTRDVFHTESRRWLEQVLADDLIVAPGLVLPEVGGALARQTSRPELAKRALGLLQRLPNSRLAIIDAALAGSAAELAAGLRLRGADALYVALAEMLAVPLVTWDNEQRERWGNRVATFTPSELLTATR